MIYTSIIDCQVDCRLFVTHLLIVYDVMEYNSLNQYLYEMIYMKRLVVFLSILSLCSCTIVVPGVNRIEYRRWREEYRFHNHSPRPIIVPRNGGNRKPIERHKRNEK